MTGNNIDISHLNGKLSSQKKEEEEESIDLRELLNKYINHLPLFIISVIVCVLGGFLFLRYKSPVYNTSINILIKDDAKKSGSQMSKEILSQLMSGGQSTLANEVELIKSYTLMGKVVETLGTNTYYGAKGRIKETEIYNDSRYGKFIVFESVKDSSAEYEVVLQIKDNKIWYLKEGNETEIKNNALVKEGDFSFSVRIKDFNLFNPLYKYKAIWNSPTETAKALLAKSIVIDALNKEASIITLSLESAQPTKARDIFNTLSVEYNKADVEDKNRETDSTIKFIDQRLLLIAGELGIVETGLQNFREQNNVIAIEGQEKFELDRMKDIRAKMDVLDIQIQVADMIKDYVNNPSRKFSLAPSSLGIQDPALLGLVQQYNEQVLRREELLKTLPPGNIAITTIESQLQQLQSNIIETTNNLKASYRSAYNKSKGDNDQILASMNAVPRKEKQLLEIARQQGIKEKLYLYLLEKREEAAISRASAVGNSRPIDPAVTQKIATSPKKLMVLALALVVGLAVPMGYIFIKDLLANKVVTRNDIVKVTKAPIIGEISHSNMSGRSIVADKSRGVIPEQFRIIRTNLQYFIPDKTKSTLLVTSSMPGEGKTFISMNMGAVLATAPKKVVLLEFDMRKPKITEALGINHNGQGLSTYLTGNASLNDILIPIEGFDNYFFIPTGPIPPNPAELLINKKLGHLFKELKEEFDHIIIDSPPTIIVSDSKVLSNYSDINFYVIRQRYTVKEHLKFIDELYETQTLKNMALVVNDVKLTGAQGYHGSAVAYGYGNGYNYDYSAGYGYGEKDGKKGWRRIFSAKD
jgi:tyrosine-protein kinase Etk/Wzc